MTDRRSCETKIIFGFSEVSYSSLIPK